jgi:hypothetical protein
LPPATAPVRFAVPDSAQWKRCILPLR